MPQDAFRRSRMPGRAIRNLGQTATEYMLIISVVVIAVVAAAYEFVPLFKEGVQDLGSDVKQMLSTGRGNRGGGAAPSHLAHL